MSLSQIGVAQIEEGGCGDGAMVYFSLRRPLYVFCDISNFSRDPVRLTALRARRRSPSGFEPRPFAEDLPETATIPVTPVLLNPNDTLIVPTSVLLGPFEADDLRTDYSVDSPISEEQSQSIGLRIDALEAHPNPAEEPPDYFRIGPSIEIEAVEFTTPAGSVLVQSHKFHPGQCYLWHRAWHVGSCPHMFYRDVYGTWSYVKEIFRGGWRNSATERIVVPRNVTLLRIVELDFETSFLTSFIVDGVQQLNEPRRLTRGEHFDFYVRPGSSVELQGLYDCAISKPACAAHVRQKRSLLASYAMGMACA